MTEKFYERQEQYIERTFEFAREAGGRGDNPYGSVLVVDEEIVMAELNRERTGNDIAGHPELALARRGAAHANSARKSGRAQ
jgi:tRNA(Arg) A34 adenosine deaminase TadA